MKLGDQNQFDSATEKKVRIVEAKTVWLRVCIGNHLVPYRTSRCYLENIFIKSPQVVNLRNGDVFYVCLEGTFFFLCRYLLFWC